MIIQVISTHDCQYKQMQTILISVADNRPLMFLYRIKNLKDSNDPIFVDVVLFALQ